MSAEGKDQLAEYIRRKIAVTGEQLSIILSHFHPLSVKRNEMLLNVGEPSGKIHFILNGCLRTYFIQNDGTEATRRFAFENSFTSALMSFITNDPSKEYIQALEDSDLLYIPRNDFYKLLHVIPE